LESIAILNISIPRDYCLETLFIGTKPMTYGMKLDLINLLLDDLIIKLTRFILLALNAFCGILKIDDGRG
jgi:hypothetical protein